jgi:hypothetical protein
MPSRQSEGADRAWWSGRSSKPRWRRLRLLRWVRFPHAPATFLVASWLLSSTTLAAQIPDSTALPPSRPATAQATARALRPLPAFFHSLLIPGWGQSKIDRKLTAALFVAWEGVTLGMTLKAGGEVRYLRRIGSDSARVEDKKRERQDWLTLLLFNHLFSGLEAYVGSHLQDFPADVRLRSAPGGFGVEAVIPLRIP